MKMNGHASITITVVMEPDGEEVYAYCPAFKGLHVGAPSEEEAKKRIIEALGAYIESLERHGEPLPIGPDCSIQLPKTPTDMVPVGSTSEKVEVPCPSLVPAGVS